MLLNRWSCSVPGGEKTLIDCFRLRSVCHLPSLGPSQPGTGPVKQRHLFSQSDTYAWTWNLRLSLFTIICPINDSVWLQMRKYTVDYLTDEEEHSSVRTLISVSGSGSFDLICICICIFFWLSLWSTAGGMRFCCAFVYTHTHAHSEEQPSVMTGFLCLSHTCSSSDRQRHRKCSGHLSTRWQIAFSLLMWALCVFLSSCVVNIVPLAFTRIFATSKLQPLSHPAVQPLAPLAPLPSA